MHIPPGPAFHNSKLLRFPLPILPNSNQMDALPPAKLALVNSNAGAKKFAPASALAHDARNALASLQLIADLLAEPGVLAPAHAHLAGDVQTVAGALTGLVKNFEALGSKSKPTPKPAPVRSASDVVNGLARLLETIAGPRVDVHVSTESKLGGLRMDEDALGRVLSNLVKNASEAMPQGGTVRVTARRALSLRNPAVLIQVADNGPGIPAWAVDQIFEPGWSTKMQQKSACGLGLAIVRELVEAAGGTVRVGSTPRRGTIFELRLPCESR